MASHAVVAQYVGFITNARQRRHYFPTMDMSEPTPTVSQRSVSCGVTMNVEGETHALVIITADAHRIPGCQSCT